MMRLKQYKTALVVPSEDEIRECLRIAKAESCIVRINYFVPYCGCCHLDVDPESTFEDCYNRVHIGNPI